jgi:hypothetical protein
MQKLHKINQQTYITIFQGLSHLLPHVDEATLAGWDRAMSQFVEAGSVYGILVDRGNGFWREHCDLWQDEGNAWFRIKTNSIGCAQLADRFILRQKIMLRLNIGREPMKRMSSIELLQHQAMKFSSEAWPQGIIDVQEQQDFVYDPKDDDNLETSQAVGAPNKTMEQFGSAEEMREYYELPGEGQQRHWIRNSALICCGVTSSRWSGTQPSTCEKPESCTYCRALSTKTADDANEMDHCLMAAKLRVFSRDNDWTPLPDASLFEFVMELSRRLSGQKLQK